MLLFQIAIVIVCFSFGCIFASNKAKGQGMLGMAKFWSISSALGFAAALVCIIIKIFMG